MPTHGEMHPVPHDRPPMDSCVYCHRFVHMVRVAAHLQCPGCAQIVETCCEGQSLQVEYESQMRLL